MAYIDDNNDLAAGKGRDPIGELDDELERLLKELGESEQPPKGAEEASHDAPTAIAEAEPEEDHIDAAQPAPTAAYGDDPQPPKKHGKTILIIILCVILLGGIAFGGWKLFEWVSQRNSTQSDNNVSYELETFSDPEIGDVTVKKVEGALNTYDIDNLVKNDNGYYEYVENGKVTSEIGVDIAEYQGDVDFEKVKNSGVDFVVLRIGGRYYSEEGKMFADGRFDEYYEKATAAGLKVGAYFFSQATTAEEAVDEAEYVIKLLDGRKLQYPVAFDWEIIEDDEARTDNIGGSTITAMAEAFCDAVEKEGYRSMVYASTSLMLQSYDFETMKDYEFWLADYREFPIMYYDFAIWQYAKDGTVNGVDGTVDLNICFKPY